MENYAWMQHSYSMYTWQANCRMLFILSIDWAWKYVCPHFWDLKVISLFASVCISWMHRTNQAYIEKLQINENLLTERQNNFYFKLMFRSCLKIYIRKWSLEKDKIQILMRSVHCSNKILLSIQSIVKYRSSQLHCIIIY